MRLRSLAWLLLLAPACDAGPAGRADLGDAERSWSRALRAARRADWPYARIGVMRALLEQSAQPRPLCDALYDLADAGTRPEEALEILRAAALALAEGAPGDPVAASVQLMARARWPWEVQVQALGILPRTKDPEALVRVIDRASVFRTEPWTALQFLKDLTANQDLAPLADQADLFDEALGRKGRPHEAQLVLVSFRNAVSEGFPSKDLAAACRRRIRRGATPGELEAFLKEAAAWPAPPLERAQALRLIAAGLAHNLPDEEVAAFGPFVARSSLDPQDAGVLADRLLAGVRSGLRGRELLQQVLEDFSGARPAEPRPR